MPPVPSCESSDGRGRSWYCRPKDPFMVARQIGGGRGTATVGSNELGTEGWWGKGTTKKYLKKRVVIDQGVRGGSQDLGVVSLRQGRASSTTEGSESWERGQGEGVLGGLFSEGP